MKQYFLLLPLLLIAACDGKPKKDYESSAACAERGIKAGSPDYDACLKEERSARMLEQQREEFEQRKRDEEYWRNRRAIGF